MSSNKTQKMLSATLYVILGIVLAAAVILILPVYQKYRNMQTRVARLEQEDRELWAEYQTMLAEVHDLENSSLAIERVAREKYKLCRENEQVLIYK
ncbi:MAG: cell division protein FtsL [Lentisphaeria bacterium]|nr:cell division protein FtsL [Lentisphaeria bacterium]